MKPPERFPPDDSREWLNRARSNLAMARNRVPDAYLEDLCFEAQQAAEKAIKSLLLRRNIEFYYMYTAGSLELTHEPIPATYSEDSQSSLGRQYTL